MTPHTRLRSLPPGPVRGHCVAPWGRASFELDLREAA